MIEPDVVGAKIATIRRCLDRIRTVTRLDPASLNNIDNEDIFVLNLQRAVQAAIDLGAHVLVGSGYQVPTTLRDIFSVLEQHQFLTNATSQQMQKMCGFRNIAVHEYQTLNKAILKAILTDHLADLDQFCAEIAAHLPTNDTNTAA